MLREKRSPEPVSDRPPSLSQQLGGENEDVDVARIRIPFIKMDVATADNGEIPLFHPVDFFADAHGDFAA